MTRQEYIAITVGLVLKKKVKKIAAGLTEREREKRDLDQVIRAAFLEEAVFRQT